MAIKEKAVIKRILSKLSQFVVVIFCVSFFTFTLVYLAPGDAAELVLALQGEGASQEVINELREEMGLNDPFLVQYGRWVGNVAHGDLGISYKNGHTVTSEITKTFLNTLLLSVVSTVVLILVAFPLGIYSALHHGRLGDTITRIITILGISMPQFWLALLLLLIFSVKLRLLPVAISMTPEGMIMPVITVAVDLICIFARQIRAAILEEMNQQYVTGLRARGVPRNIIMFRNVLPNSMTSIITLLGLALGTMISGSIIVEQIFGWPGIGKLTYEAISYRDYPVIQAYVLVMAVVYIVLNLVVDALVFLQNPRARAEAMHTSHC